MEQKEFKITILDEGKVSKVAVLGQRIFLHKELSFFIHREHKGGEFRHPKLLWVITEEKTGRSIAIHTTKKLVIEKAREIVKEKGIELIKKIISQYLPLSPESNEPKI